MLSVSSVLIANAADTTVQWQLRTASPSVAAALKAVRYSNGQWLAFGEKGVMAKSTDGIIWTSQKSGTNLLNAVTYADGKWVVVGNEGIVLTSSDAISWTVQNSGVSFALYDVCYGDGLWVASGDRNTIITSPDSRVWMQRGISVGQFRSYQLLGVGYGDHRWVALGIQYSRPYVYSTILTSTNAIYWTSVREVFTRGGFENFPFKVSYANGVWVAAGGGVGGAAMLTSSDGFNWIDRKTPPRINQFLAIGYGDGLWLATQANLMATSPDAINWTERSSGTDQYLYGIAYGNGLWVAVGSVGTILTSTQVIGPPRLSITYSGTNAVLAWPADAQRFVLETASQLTAPQDWKVVTTAPATVNSQNTIIDVVSGSTRFYRLRQQ